MCACASPGRPLERGIVAPVGRKRQPDGRRPQPVAPAPGSVNHSDTPLPVCGRGLHHASGLKPPGTTARDALGRVCAEVVRGPFCSAGRRELKRVVVTSRECRGRALGLKAGWRKSVRAFVQIDPARATRARRPPARAP